MYKIIEQGCIETKGYGTVIFTTLQDSKGNKYSVEDNFEYTKVSKLVGSQYIKIPSDKIKAEILQVIKEIA